MKRPIIIVSSKHPKRAPTKEDLPFTTPPGCEVLLCGFFAPSRYSTIAQLLTKAAKHHKQIIIFTDMEGSRGVNYQFMENAPALVLMDFQCNYWQDYFQAIGRGSRSVAHTAKGIILM